MTPLSPSQRQALLVDGFVVVAGPAPAERLARLADAYDAAIRDADPRDLHIGRTTTRVSALLDRGSEFDDVFVHAPLLEACELVLGAAFKLSSLHARTLRPHAPALGLHVDVARDAPDAPLLGFILMIDGFREDNGATRFVPGSHRAPGGDVHDLGLPACGAAGSMILYDASILHGHGANGSSEPRRSIQGAFLRRDAHAATDFAARLRAETRARLSPHARHLLAL